MFRLLSFAVIVIFSSSLKGQNYEWAFQAGGSGTDEAQGIAYNGRNIFVVADYAVNISYGNYYLLGSNSANCLVAKHDTLKNLQWVQKIYNANSKGISTDRFGNCYLTGNCGNATFFGKVNNISVTQQGNGDAFIAKYDTAGNVAWVRLYGHSATNDWGLAIKTNAAGNSFIIGRCDYNSAGEYFISKYEPNGNLIWRKTASLNIFPTAIDIDENDNCYVTGSFRDTAIFGNFHLTSSGLSNIFIAKYDAFGNVIWAKKEGSNYEESNGLKISNHGALYFTGSYSAPSIFGNDTLIGTSHRQMFLAKYDTSGNFQWIKASGAKEGRALTTDIEGNCVVTGLIKDTAIFGEGSYYVKVISAKKNGDIFVAKYDTAGAFDWVSSPSGSQWSLNISNAICSDLKNNYYLSGSFTEKTIFGNLSLYAPPPVYGDNSDIFIVKMHEAILTTSLSQIHINDLNVSVYPNPSSDKFFIEISDKDHNDLRIEVKNVIGETIVTYSTKDYNGILTLVINLADKPKGVYFIEISSGNKKTTKKIVLE